ncbi:type VI secretion system baseplate subunit TssE [Burkholderia plantarii]|uniref:type VI secretion system baseplate subunit TssE n=1 Tax=Burkholderia plantarii TaxID=41899 RepID=UPI00272D42AD|nr:type VI secretion system baseplate subunit TssE [Burkholderia plantarii]WLE58809.1 type VI secretion system baseplate subunit TssE [Burkholderia plantarii]
MTEPKRHPTRSGSLVAHPPRRANAHLMPTLLDRLRDDAPHRLVEAPEEYAVTRKQMRDIVQRDLAYLLNTTSIEDRIERDRHPRAAASTVNFGVPPLAGTFLASRQWNDIERMIRQAIIDFEPRLIPDSLAVSPRLSEDASGQHNVLAFEVRGLVHMDPYPLAFMVQSSLDLETSEIQITGMRAG